MNAEVKALAAQLSALRERLVATPKASPGFGEMRALHDALTDALIDAGDKADADLAAEIQRVSKAVVDEWSTNRDKLSGWTDALKGVVSAVGSVLSVGKLGNPLTALLA